MSLTLEVPAEVEARLCAVAEQQGRDLSDYTLAAALEKVSREETRAAQLAGLEEMTRLNEELEFYEFET